MEWCQDLGSEQSLREKSSSFLHHLMSSLVCRLVNLHVSPSTLTLLKKRQRCVQYTQHIHGVEAKGLRECQAPPRVTTGHEKSPCPHSRSELLLEEETMKCLQGLKVEWKSGLAPPTEVLGLRLAAVKPLSQLPHQKQNVGVLPHYFSQSDPWFSIRVMLHQQSKVTASICSHNLQTFPCRDHPVLRQPGSAQNILVILDPSCAHG